MREEKRVMLFLQKFRFILSFRKELGFTFVLSEQISSLLFCLNHLAEVQHRLGLPEKSH